VTARQRNPDAVQVASSWSSRVGQVVVFLVALASFALFGVVHPDSVILGEALAFCLAMFVLLRLPSDAISKFKALGVELEMKEELARVLDRPQQVDGPVGMPEAPKVVASTQPPKLEATETSATTPKLEAAETSAATPKLEVAEISAATPMRDPRWNRSGHLYWLGNNVIYAYPLHDPRLARAT